MFLKVLYLKSRTLLNTKESVKDERKGKRGKEKEEKRRGRSGARAEPPLPTSKLYVRPDL